MSPLGILITIKAVFRILSYNTNGLVPVESLYPTAHDRSLRQNRRIFIQLVP